MDANAFAGPIVVTVLYLMFYYGTMLHIARTKFRLLGEYKARGERFDRYFGQDREMLAADRIQLNMLEHMPPFLILLWLNAVFVSTAFATVIGGIYLFTRVMYPFILGEQVGPFLKNRIFIATGPGYLVMLVYCIALVYTAVS